MSLQVQTFAGTGAPGTNNGPDYQATFIFPKAIARTSDGSIYVGESETIRRIKDGQVTTIFTSAEADWISLSAIIVGPETLIYAINAYNNTVYYINIQSSGLVTPSIVSITGITTLFPTSIAIFRDPPSLGFYLADNGSRKIYRVYLSSFSSGVGGSYTTILNSITSVAVDPTNYQNIFYNDGFSIRNENGDGSSLIAGSASDFGYANGLSRNARFRTIHGITCDGNNPNILFVSDYGNQTIRKVDITGEETSTYAGDAIGGFKNGPALLAKFNHPYNLVGPGDGIVYVADYDNNRIRIIDNGGSDGLVAPGVGFLYASITA